MHELVPAAQPDIVFRGELKGQKQEIDNLIKIICALSPAG